MEKGASQSDLDQGQDHNRFCQIGWREKDNQDIQRTGQIIGKQREEIDAHATRPGEQQAATGSEFILKLRHKGCVLVIKVDCQDISVMHRIDAARHVADKKDQGWQGKGQKGSPVFMIQAARSLPNGFPRIRHCFSPHHFVMVDVKDFSWTWVHRILFLA